MRVRVRARAFNFVSGRACNAHRPNHAQSHTIAADSRRRSRLADEEFGGILSRSLQLSLTSLFLFLFLLLFAFTLPYVLREMRVRWESDLNALFSRCVVLLQTTAAAVRRKEEALCVENRRPCVPLCACVCV